MDALALRTSLQGSRGVIEVRSLLRPLSGRTITRAEVFASRGDRRLTAALDIDRADEGMVRATGRLIIDGPDRWWPWTHGEPALWDAGLLVSTGAETIEVAGQRVGFRTLAPGPHPGHDPLTEGLSLHVNDTPIFARGAVWIPPDPMGLSAPEDRVAAALGQMRDAGMNMVRLAGIGNYEDRAFHDLCDEMGILLWQELMLANMDYPFADPAFHELIAGEASDLVGNLAHRPSLAVLCGNSEVEQQVAMLGLDPQIARGDFYAHELPALAAKAGSDAIYIPSSPCGGDLPFRPGAGVAHYFGVGGYRRPLTDVRIAEVRFASECLALSNVPSEVIESLGQRAPGSAMEGGNTSRRRKRRRTSRTSATTTWPSCSPSTRPSFRGRRARALPRLSRAVTGEVMAEVLGEWRHSRSPCGGGLILWWRDPHPGAGVGHRRLRRTAQGRLPPTPHPCPGGRVDDRRGPRRPRRPRGQRPS